MIISNDNNTLAWWLSVDLRTIILECKKTYKGNCALELLIMDPFLLIEMILNLYHIYVVATAILTVSPAQQHQGYVLRNANPNTQRH